MEIVSFSWPENICVASPNISDRTSKIDTYYNVRQCHISQHIAFSSERVETMFRPYGNTRYIACYVYLHCCEINSLYPLKLNKTPSDYLLPYGLICQQLAVNMSQIAKFMGPNGAHLGPVGPRWVHGCMWALWTLLSGVISSYRDTPGASHIKHALQAALGQN